jgi:hypothetical protein
MARARKDPRETWVSEFIYSLHTRHQLLRDHGEVDWGAFGAGHNGRGSLFALLHWRGIQIKLIEQYLRSAPVGPSAVRQDATSLLYKAKAGGLP